MSAGLSFLSTLRAASEDRPMPALGLARLGNLFAVTWLGAVAGAGLATVGGGVSIWPGLPPGLLHGAALASTVAILPPLAALFAGSLLGLAAARSGWLQALVGRPLEWLTVLPGLVLAALVLAIGGAGGVSLLLALIVTLLPPVSRHMRLAARDIGEEPWMEEAHALGMPPRVMLRRHVLPALLAEARGLAPRLAIRALLVESALSAGLAAAFSGPQALWRDTAWPGLSWGAAIARAPDTEALLAPAVALTLTLLALARLALVARRHQEAKARRRLGAVWTGLLP
jgi:ABC-type dipeptide/oligopeptide/nickel transport system permease subunit